MKGIKLTICAIVLMIIAPALTLAQSLPVGTPGFDDLYRREQLMGNVDSTVSFTVRPIFPDKVIRYTSPKYPDSVTLYNDLRYERVLFNSRNNRFKFSILPFSIQSQLNTHHPYGWNDGAMIPAKGLQTVFSGGFFAKYGPLTIQLRPELVRAQNAEFETLNAGHYDILFAFYYDIYNNIDLPARFGTGSYNKLSWGQSSIRLNFNPISIGLSNENLWWGPGIRSSLLMSNTAPGFKHLTLNTMRPIKTPVGSFEGQLIAGKLENSGFAPLTPDHYYFGNNLYVPKRDDWRYLSGVVLTWQPKWIPGLFLGFDKAAQLYHNDRKKLGDYLPFFSSIEKVNANDYPLNRRDEISSMFARWLWTQEQAEIYFQWGHFNYRPDLTQALLAPDDSRAYVFGIRKILPFNRARNESIMIGIEATQLQQNSVDKIAKGEEFYVSQSIRQGYTNQGEALGAGIGPGANLQTFNLSWMKGLKRIGFQIERYLHNNDFYYYAFTPSKDLRRHWVDITYGFDGEWDFKNNLVVNARLQRTKSINYQWYLQQKPGDGFFGTPNDAYNIQFLAGLTYRF